MAISFDASATNRTTGSSASFSHTCSGNQRVLFVAVGIWDNFTTDVLAGVTYNGVTLTRISMAAAQANTRTYLYAMVNPPTGSHTVAISVSVSTNISVTSMSYTGATQDIGTLVAFNTMTSAPTSTINASLFCSAGGWAIMSLISNSGGLSASTGAVSRGIPGGGVLVAETEVSIPIPSPFLVPTRFLSPYQVQTLTGTLSRSSLPIWL